MGYDSIKFTENRLRVMGVKRMSVDNERLLTVKTDTCSIEVTVSTYEQTYDELDEGLSELLEDTWQIGEILEYFDEKWKEIDEFLNKKEEEAIKDQ